MTGQIYTVSQVNRYLKDVLDQDPLLRGILISGEISNYKCYPSGHHYFSLKDSEGAISCVMFRRSAMSLRFRPQNGMQVLAYGSVSVYPRDGKYQLYCERMMPNGLGDLYAAFEQLKEKLSREGLFDPAHKKALPAYPQRIALITSAAGAAVRDMLRILKARWPMSQPVLLSVRVQGAEAPAELIGALRYANRWKVADLIIIGRGGGSLEDLWAFNDEGLARAIYASEIPVISAVGHEPDVTIADYVADLRAATPSNGAELAVPDQAEVYAALGNLEKRMNAALKKTLTQCESRLERCRGSRMLTHPENLIRERQLRLDGLSRRLESGFAGNLNREKARFVRCAASLDALSPLKVLSRGYSMTTTADGSVLSSVTQAEPGDSIAVRLSDGQLDCTVNHRRSDHGESKDL